MKMVHTRMRTLKVSFTIQGSGLKKNDIMLSNHYVPLSCLFFPISKEKFQNKNRTNKKEVIYQSKVGRSRKAQVFGHI